MKRVAKPVFFIVLAVILAFTGIVFFGVHTQYGDFTTTIIRGVSDIRWGIDIRGGVDVTFTSPADYDATNEEVDAAKSIVETRLVANNITDYEVYVDYNSDKIIVRFPWQAEDDSFDPEAAVKELGATALLTFREGSEKSLSDGQTYEDLPLIISGSVCRYSLTNPSSSLLFHIVPRLAATCPPAEKPAIIILSGSQSHSLACSRRYRTAYAASYSAHGNSSGIRLYLKIAAFMPSESSFTATASPSRGE